MVCPQAPATLAWRDKAQVETSKAAAKEAWTKWLRCRRSTRSARNNAVPPPRPYAERRTSESTSESPVLYHRGTTVQRGAASTTLATKEAAEGASSSQAWARPLQCLTKKK